MKSNITTIQEAFIAQGIDPNVRPDVSMLPEIDKVPTLHEFERSVLIRALNSEGLDKTWEPDYTDYDQDKFEHVYYYDEQAGWSLHGVGDWRSYTLCGSRRVFRTREIANYAWEQFPEYFKNL
ncbi:hypothetical protein [Flavobacterium suncheonense]|uniref:Uncharacterized protein n=1 Tax=Flavobacterium suncheonense GH29-5 = DSM 17707 TaxID=1121899 RepID=A0A0A2MNA6_9FLAO|nr:hypothetical protein [Flavobacterium suncheonense]KGO89755.1 hypothetical protein Q764_06085 [Flavobacterium suncheonense GH29-5 = DSM 17707]